MVPSELRCFFEAAFDQRVTAVPKISSVERQRRSSDRIQTLGPRSVHMLVFNTRRGNYSMSLNKT